MLKIYIISAILALLGFVLLMKRTLRICIDDYNAKEIKHPKGMSILYIRLFLMCLIPILNIILAIFTLVVFIFFDNNKLLNTLDLKDKLKN